MNAFDYVVKLQEIQKAKTQKAIKEIIVPLISEYKEDISSSWGRSISYGPSSDRTADAINYYHILRIGVDNYSGESLQDFVIDSCNTLERHFVDALLRNDLTYEQFMEAFKYNKSLTIEGNISKMLNAIEIIDNKELPCRIYSGLYSSSNYNYIFDKARSGVPYNTKHLLELEAVKRTKGRNDLTLLNHLLERYYEDTLRDINTDKSHTEQSKVVDLLRTDMDTVMKETERRLNEQANAIQDPLPEAV